MIWSRAMHGMTIRLLHLHRRKLLLNILRVNHLILHIIGLVRFIGLKLSALGLRLDGHHLFGRVVRVHLRWDGVVRVIDRGALRNRPHRPWVVVRRRMNIGEWVLRGVHVRRHHVIYWLHEHVRVVERLRHGRLLLVLPLLLLGRRRQFLLG